MSVGELEIGDKWIGSQSTWMRLRDGSWEQTPPEMLLPAAEVLAAIEAHRKAGTRVLLVTLGMCGGGNVAGSLEIMSALRRFAAEVGPVIAHVSGIIGSTGPFIAIAADFVIMAERAKMIFHAASCGKEPSPEFTWCLAPVLASRCAASEEVALEWLSRGLPGSDQPVTIGDTTACLAAGLADAVGTLEQARILAHAVASGLDLPVTERGELLRQRAPVALPAVPLAVTNALSTTNYAEDANGFATAGVKLDHQGVALKAAANNIQINKKTVEQMFALMAASNYEVGRIPSASAPSSIAETSLPRLVAVGNNFCYTSDTNGNTWTSRTIPAGVYQAVIWNGSGLVAVGTNVCATSPDGITWTARTIPAGSWRYMIWTGTQFLAIRSDLNANTCVTSPDGITWTARTLTAPGAGGGWRGIAWNGSLFVLAGYTLAAGGNLIYTSPDGITWTQRTVPYQGGTPTVNMVSTAGYAFGKFIVWGSISGGNIVYYSADGITWSYTTSVPSFSPGWIATGDKAMVAVGQAGIARGAVATSHDGVNWSLYDLGGIAIPFHAIWSAGYFGRARRFYVVGSAVAAATDPNFAASLALEP